MEDETEDENPIVLRSEPCSYEELLELMKTVDFGRSAPEPLVFSADLVDFGRSSSKPLVLPPDLAKRVLSFLTVQKVKAKEVWATYCSSHDGVHPLPLCLTDNSTSWWLAKPGSMPKGRGEQWVQFQLNPKNKLRRLCAVSVKIPPMPQGPLSVREFCLQAFHLERGWHAITPTFHVDNLQGWQKFSFEPVDVDEVRLACFSNQLEQHLGKLHANRPNDKSLIDQLRRFESVGFFCVKFE